MLEDRSIVRSAGHRKQSTNRLCLALLMGGWLINASAYTLSDAGLKQLQDARELASKVYARTGDAQGAVGVLYEAGIDRLVEARPDNLDRRRYLAILEEYAGYIARIDGREQEAAQLLKRIIQRDPTRESAYLSLGELYYRRYQQTHEEQHRRIYTGAYEKYVRRLRERGERRLLPDRVVEAVYPDGVNVCDLATRLKEQGRLKELAWFFNPETGMKQVSPGDEAIRSLAESAVSFAGLVSSADGSVRTAEVDIDNDGDRERRYSVNAGGCERTAFYKEFGEQTVLFSNELLDRYYATGRICAGDELFPLRFAGTNYLFESQDGGDFFEIFKLRPSGGYDSLCRAGSVGALKQHLGGECTAPICRHLAANIETIVAEDGRVGAEQAVTETPALTFDAPDLQPYIASPHKYKADIDNDGRSELIIHRWREQPGERMSYSHRLFRRVDGVWQPWQWPLPVEADRWFFVEPFDGANHVVTYRIVRLDTGGRRYELEVYRLVDGQVEPVGTLKTRRPSSAHPPETEAAAP